MPPIVRADLPLPALMLITETATPDGDPTWPIVSSAISGGVNMVQLRDRASMPDDFERAALEMRDVTRGRAKLIVNDSFNVMANLHLDGIHLPEAAFDIDRALVSFPVLVGRSVHSVEAAIDAQESGVDYLIAGNVYETHSHPGKDGVGLDFLCAICHSVSVPVLAIGGITPANITDCVGAGASGVVVRSGIMLSDEPACAARGYIDALCSAWAARQLT